MYRWFTLNRKRVPLVQEITKTPSIEGVLVPRRPANKQMCTGGTRLWLYPVPAVHGLLCELPSAPLPLLLAFWRCCGQILCARDLEANVLLLFSGTWAGGFA